MTDRPWRSSSTPTRAASPVADDIATAYERAYECDPVSAFGGIVAVNRAVPVAHGRGAGPDLHRGRRRPGVRRRSARGAAPSKKNLRVLEAAPRRRCPTWTCAHRRRLPRADRRHASTIDRAAWTVVTDRAPTDQQWADLEFAWRVVARVSRNSIVLVKDGQVVGIGAGQQNRGDAGRSPPRRPTVGPPGGACASRRVLPVPRRPRRGRRRRRDRRDPAGRLDPRRRGDRRRQRARASPWSSPASATSATDPETWASKPHISGYLPKFRPEAGLLGKLLDLVGVEAQAGQECTPPRPWPAPHHTEAVRRSMPRPRPGGRCRPS